MTKTCRKCGEDKDLCQFYPSKANKDKRSSWCKSCHSIHKKEYHQKVISNPYMLRKKRERDRVRNRKKYREHQEYYVDYYQRNKERLLEYQRQYRQRIKEKNACLTN